MCVSWVYVEKEDGPDDMVIEFCHLLGKAGQSNSPSRKETEELPLSFAEIQAGKSDTTGTEISSADFLRLLSTVTYVEPSDAASSAA